MAQLVCRYAATTKHSTKILLSSNFKIGVAHNSDQSRVLSIVRLATVASGAAARPETATATLAPAATAASWTATPPPTSGITWRAAAAAPAHAQWSPTWSWSWPWRTRRSRSCKRALWRGPPPSRSTLQVGVAIGNALVLPSPQSPRFWVSGYCTKWRIRDSFDSSYSRWLNAKT